jgi:hypothetical protein
MVAVSDYQFYDMLLKNTKAVAENVTSYTLHKEVMQQ